MSEVVEREGEISYARQIQSLKKQLAQKKRNMEFAHQLMQTTFSQKRRLIWGSPRTAAEILDEFPLFSLFENVS